MLLVEGKVNKQQRKADMTSALLRLYCLLRQVRAAIKTEASDPEA